MMEKDNNNDDGKSPFDEAFVDLSSKVIPRNEHQQGGRQISSETKQSGSFLQAKLFWEFGQ
jgi:hypothetical protein